VKDEKEMTKQKIMVFQQNGSGEKKIEGLRRYGKDLFELEVINIDKMLPLVIDDTSEYLPENISCDLVLDFLKHNDLSTDLADLCLKNNIPVVASGKKIVDKKAITPPTCCGLPRQDALGNYGEKFGAPEFEVEIEDGKISAVKVLRGAPCGASWEVAKRLIGHPADDAVRKIGLETQFYCYADPSGWDPIYGKSPVHFAGKIHSKGLQKAIEKLLSVI
jgi:thymidylate synthase